jgi:hypothetical protein
MEVTTWAKRRQSDGRAVTQVKRLSLVRCYPRADRVENLEGNSRPPLMARWSETAAGSESTARRETEASRKPERSSMVLGRDSTLNPSMPNEWIS